MLPPRATVTVVGATGFVGRRLVARLLAEGLHVRALARAAPEPGHWRDDERLEGMTADLTDPSTPQKASTGVWAIINLVGTTAARSADCYYALHCAAPARLAAVARANGVEKFVHFSAMGVAEDAPALADRSKAAGEIAVKRSFERATIVRPALVFGEGYHFFSRFRPVARAPLLPLIGRGRTLFQPIFVDDLVEAVVRILANNETSGRTFELGNAEVLSLRMLLDKLCAAMHRPPPMPSVPFGAARVLAALTQRIPGAPLTADQVRLLQTDKVILHPDRSPASLGLDPNILRLVDDYLLGTADRPRSPA